MKRGETAGDAGDQREQFAHLAAEAAPVLPGVAGWLAQAGASALLGMVVGAIVVAGHGLVGRLRGHDEQHG